MILESFLAVYFSLNFEKNLKSLPVQVSVVSEYYILEYQNHGHHQLTVVNQFYILELKAWGCQNGSELQLNLSALL